MTGRLGLYCYCCLVQQQGMAIGVTHLAGQMSRTKAWGHLHQWPYLIM